MDTVGERDQPLQQDILRALQSLRRLFHRQQAQRDRHAGLQVLTMKRGTVRAWYWVHKWTSLVCTLFLLMLCVTGLPLIFGEEIYHIPTGGAEEVTAEQEGATPVKLDRITEGWIG